MNFSCLHLSTLVSPCSSARDVLTFVLVTTTTTTTKELKKYERKGDDDLEVENNGVTHTCRNRSHSHPMYVQREFM
jgi:hypothetical protein